MFIKVTTLPGGLSRLDDEVAAMVFVGPGVMITPVNERGVTRELTKLVFPDGRAVYLAHSMAYMEALILGQHQRPGLVSDVDRQLAATGKQ